MISHGLTCGECIHLYSGNACHVDPPQLVRQELMGDAYHTSQGYDWARPMVYTSDQACSRFDDGTRDADSLSEQGVPPNPRHRAIQV